MSTRLPSSPASPIVDEGTKLHVLIIVSLSHLLNDSSQSLLQPTYPLLKETFSLTFTQIGDLTLSYQLTASLLQPLIGIYTDKHPLPYSLSIGAAFTTLGLLIIAFAPSYYWLMAGAMVLGTGSSIFHPESSRVARMASGGKYGLAQSIFQVGGNIGSSCGPLLAAAIIIPYGRASISWFAVFPFCAIFLLIWVGGWASRFIQRTSRNTGPIPKSPVSRGVVIRTFATLLVLIFSKYFYTASISSYLIFYMTNKFGISDQSAQIRLFLYLASMAAGTLIGGPVGDRIGRKYIIWISILGAAPFTLALPYLDLTWTTVMIFVIGFVIGSAFSAIVVFAQELVPGRVGLVAGLFFGLSFGMGGVGAAVLGRMADTYGIDYVYHICSFLPLLGLVAVFLPNLKERKTAA